MLVNKLKSVPVKGGNFYYKDSDCLKFKNLQLIMEISYFCTGNNCLWFDSLELLDT